MKKRLFSTFVVLAMVLAMLPTVAFATDDTGTGTGTAEHTCTSTCVCQTLTDDNGGDIDWQPLTQYIIDGSDSDNAIYSSLSGYYYLAGDITLPAAKTINVNYDLTICLNGYTIKGTATEGSKPVFKVNNNATLNLYDGDYSNDTSNPKYVDDPTKDDGSKITIYGGLITGGYNGKGGGVQVMYGGKFYMYGGTIAGNTATEDGGGVYVGSDSNGYTDTTFEMYGGSIIANTAAEFGGGIYIIDSSELNDVIIKDADISYNTAQVGGGIYSNAKTLTITDTTIANNYASMKTSDSEVRDAAGDGGGIYLAAYSDTERGYYSYDAETYTREGTVTMYGATTVTLNNVTIENNTAERTGGGVYAEGLVEATITDSIINNNTAELNGGGIYAGSYYCDWSDYYYYSYSYDFELKSYDYISFGVVINNSTVSITGGTLTENTAQDGGGAYVSSDNFTMNGTTVSSNTAVQDESSTDDVPVGGDGAGIYISGQDVDSEDNFGSATLTDVTISGNQADANGGGVYLEGNGATLTTATSLDITNNKADNNGGGVYISTDGTLSVDSTYSISGNTATGNGAGIYNIGTLKLEGNPTVQDVYLGSDNVITLTGEYTGSAIPVTTAEATTNDTPVTITSGASGNATASNFTSAAGYAVSVDTTTNEVVLCIPVASVTTTGDNATTTNYDTLAKAIDVAESSDTVTLLMDATTEASIYIESGVAITLDLNGFDIKYDGSNGTKSVLTVIGNLTLQDSNPNNRVRYGYWDGTTYLITSDDTIPTVPTGTTVDTLTGGVITGGTGTTVSGVALGGGVYAPNGDFTMTGGTIAGNQAATGGGVYVGNVATITGGTICSNQATKGSGVYVKSSMKLSGAPTIQDVYLANSRVITLTGAYTGSVIPLITETIPSETAPITVVEAGTDYTITSDDLALFSYTGTGDMVLLADKIQLVVWTYTLSTAGDTITADSDNDSTNGYDGGSVTIVAPTDTIYTRDAITASLTATDWMPESAPTTSDVVYYQEDSTTAMTDAPTDAGTYTAKITLVDATASVEYTIIAESKGEISKPDTSDYTYLEDGDDIVYGETYYIQYTATLAPATNSLVVTSLTEDELTFDDKTVVLYYGTTEIASIADIELDEVATLSFTVNSTNFPAAAFDGSSDTFTIGWGGYTNVNGTSETLEFNLTKVTIDEVTVGTVDAKEYTGSTQTFENIPLTSTDVLDGDTVTLTTNYTTTAATVGDYTVTGTVVLGTDDDEGYYQLATGITLSGSVSITKATHEDATATGSAMYGNEGSVSLSSWADLAGVSFAVGTVTDESEILENYSISGDTLVFTFENDADNVGEEATIDITVSSTNYVDFTIAVTLTVTSKITPTISAENFTKTYNTETITIEDITVSVEDDVTGTWAFEDGATMTNVSDSDTYTVVFTPNNLDTYVETSTNITVSITPVEITFTVDDASAYKNYSEPEYTYTQTGNLFEGDSWTIEPVIDNSTVDMSTNGTYTLTISADAGENYTITIETGTLTVTTKSSSSGSTTTTATTTTDTETTTNDDGSVTTTVETDTSTSNGTTSATVDDDTIDDAIETAVEEADGEDAHIELTVDTTTSTDTVEVELTVDAMESIADSDVESLTITTDIGSITIPSDALSSMAGQATGTEIIISIILVDSSVLTQTQQTLVGDTQVYDLHITSDSETITNFGGTEVTVTLPYELAEDESAEHIVIWYLGEDGTMEALDGTYDDESGFAMFSTPHFSYYVAFHHNNPFDDVTLDDYFYAPVMWAVELGITSGTSDSTFSPNASCTRAQAVTFLWRAYGSPEVTFENSFTDVSSDDYYYEAVLWAVSEGITNGTSDTTFSPNADCTRGQIVTFLYRAAGEPTVATTSTFTDVDSDSYCYNAILWAVENGITTDTTFSPNSLCNRGQIVTFLYRGMAD